MGELTFPLVVCLMGPTASGKTALAVALAKRLPCEIVNVDSSQIYRHLDIGSGKPALSIREKVPHHLMDFLSPHCQYSAAQFQKDALQVIAEIQERGNLPLLVGGTMLYFKALQEGLAPVPPTSSKVRQHVESWVAEVGLERAYQKLQVVDALSAQRFFPSDRQRVQRALEVYEITGRPLSFWLQQPPVPSPLYHFLNIGLLSLTTVRAVLHQRIEQRFDEMLTSGLVEEVRQLLTYLPADAACLRAVGYRQVGDYLAGKEDYEAMRAKAIAATRQLAKRQLTWLRHWPHLFSFDFLDPDLVSKIEYLLKGIKL